MVNRGNKFVFCVIGRNSVRKFLIVDMLIGSALYYGTFIIYHHIGLSFLSSTLGTAVIRKFIWKK
ncbi:hypothetical protein DS745_03995 [Anaerobacillus alkaliphilus]|uniref:Uncharacterized protein n=1 Tax=Anaerobacillus alkaliphilus TaxID=1548597 RepID=A0A4Q0VXY0_9BACI|nr:hypothetical protein DS745_03995 [Anaerobacillus alkaliphilus]